MYSERGVDYPAGRQICGTTKFSVFHLQAKKELAVTNH